MKTFIRFTALSGLFFALLTPVLRAESPWSVRLRATYLETVDKSAPFSALGLNFAADSVRVSNKLIPEIDIDYAFSDTLSAELVLTIPQKHYVNLDGAGRLGVDAVSPDGEWKLPAVFWRGSELHVDF